jgi:4-hydroxybenzoate polyprenyltransferase
VINDYADRELDPHVERTRNRPLAAGRVSAREALSIFAALLLVALGLVLLLNRLSQMVAIGAALLAASYPYMKRFTYLPQVHLGLAFSCSILMAFAAVSNEIPKLAWLLMIGNIIWAVAYDTLYAMVDREDDLLVGVKSTAILFGELDRLFVGILQLMMIAVLLLVADQARLGLYYYIGIIISLLLFGWQHYLIRQRDRQACFKAFLNNNWVGAAIFVGLVLDLSLRDSTLLQ